MENLNPNQIKSRTLTSILEGMVVDVAEDKVTIGHIVSHLKHRGFGPLLLIPALLVILPTGAVPMVPAAAGMLIAFVCVQMLIGHQSPWLPRRLRDFSLSKSRLEKTVARATPYAKKIDRVLFKRFLFLVSPLSKRLTAVFCLLLSIAMITIGFIPMLPSMLALPIFFFGLGYIAEDGLVVATGFLTIFGSVFGLWLLLH